MAGRANQIKGIITKWGDSGTQWEYSGIKWGDISITCQYLIIVICVSTTIQSLVVRYDFAIFH